MKQQEPSINPSVFPLSQHPRGSVTKLLKQGLFVYLRPYWKEQAALAGTVVLAVAFHTGLPLSLKYLIDSAIVPRDGQKLSLILGGIAVLFGLYAIGQFVQAFFQARVSIELKRDLRLKLFNKVQALPFDYLDQTEPGEITTLFAQELLTLRNTLVDLTARGLYALLKLGLTVWILLFLDWRLSLVAALILPLTTLVPRRAINRSAAADYADKYQDARVAFAVQDSVKAQPLIRALGLGKQAKARFARLIGRQEEQAAKDRYATIKQVLSSPPFLKSMVVVWTDIQQIVLQGVTIGFGAYLAWRGLLTVGTLTAFIVLLSQVGTAITALAGFFRDLISAATALERIELMTSAAVEVTDPEAAVILLPISQEICFVEVSFGYPNQESCLHQVSFSFAAKQLVALVGRSGAGKSTLLKLLLRFYDPLVGQVLLDGYDLRTVNQASFRAQIGVVLQEVILLNTSVRENICLTKPNATDAEVEAAAKLAEIHEGILSLPDGYQTLVGEGGKRLSPGQCQRIALARALLHQPSLLLLDEITSALDLEAEDAINATLRKLSKNRTIVKVTHRLSSVVEADQIVVVDNGQVVEQGSHQNLLRRRGFYHRLWQLQTGFVIRANGQYAEVTGGRLRFIPLFERLDPATLETLAAQFVSEYHEAGQTVVAQDSLGEKFYIIVRGKVAVSSKGAPDSEAIRLAMLEDGDYFGEIALLEGSLRSATVETLLPSLLLTLERDRFEKMMVDLPSLQAAVAQKARQRRLEMVNSLRPVPNDADPL